MSGECDQPTDDSASDSATYDSVADVCEQLRDSARPRPKRLRRLPTILLICALGALGALTGYNTVVLMYESTAKIRVAAFVPKLLFATEENGLMPNFDSFVKTQIELIKSGNVLKRAQQSISLEDMDELSPPLMQEQLKKNLLVSRLNDSEVIELRYRDPDPERACAMAKAIVDSYMKVVMEGSLDLETRRMQLLEERAASLRREVEGFQKRIFEMASEYGTYDLDTVVAFETEQLQAIQREIEHAMLDLAIIESGKLPEAGIVPWTIPHKLTQEEAAATDLRIQQIAAERIRLRSWVGQAADQRGGPASPTGKDQMDERLISTEEYARVLWGDVLRADQTDRQLVEERVQSLQEVFESSRAHLTAMSRISVEIEELKLMRKVEQEKLQQTTDRIEQLNLESISGGRISLLSEAELPEMPANRNVQVTFTLVGGLMGICVGLAVGLVFCRTRS